MADGNPTTWLAEISGLEINLGKPLAAELFSSVSGKLREILNNTDATKSVAGRNQAYRFTFVAPIFVRQVTISGDDLASYRKFEVSWITSTGETVESAVAPENNQVTATVAAVITSFSITPPERYYGTSTLKSVVFQGLSLDEFLHAAEQLGRGNSLREQIVKDCQERLAVVTQKEGTVAGLNTQKDAVTAEIAALTKTKETLTNDVKDLEAEGNARQGEIEKAKATQASLDTRAGQLEDQINQKSSKVEQLNQQVLTKESELRKLESDVNLFPVEISGFAAEGGSAVWRYVLMGLVPSGVLAFIAVELYNNAEQFQYVVTSGKASVWELFLSRLPYVVVSVTIAEVSFRILRMFVLEVMAIYRQRLNLSKLSVIAKDVSDSAVQGTQLTDAEIVEHRTRLKMAVLKEHLKEYLPGGFAYQEHKKPAKQSDPNVAKAA